MTTVKDIVTIYLKTFDYDGLCGFNCSCGLEDLMLCNDGPMDMSKCVPGYKTKCTCGRGCEYHLVAKKPRRKRKR